MGNYPEKTRCWLFHFNYDELTDVSRESKLENSNVDYFGLKLKKFGDKQLKIRNYTLIFLVFLIIASLITPGNSTTQIVIKNITELNASTEIECQVNNENFETGDMTGWSYNPRIMNDDYIYESSYGVNDDLPNTGYYSLYLYTHARNQMSGPRGGDLSVGRNISYSEDLGKYNLTGFVYVNRCYSVSYDNWAGVVISYFDDSLVELGRIYYQFAEYGVTGEIAPNEINLYDQRGEWLKFNRNITRDYVDEFASDPDLIYQFELAFYVRTADGTQVDDEGYCDAYFDNWYIDNKKYPLIFIGNDDFEAFGLPGSGTEIEPYLIEEYSISTDQVDLIAIRNTTVHFQIKNCNLDGQDGYTHKGIWFYNVSNGSIIENEINHCWYGIYIEHYSLLNNIMRNEISECTGVGLLIYGASDNSTVVGNNVFDSHDGMLFSSSFYNNVSKNTIYNNLYSAIRIVASKFNHFEGNILFNQSTSEGIFAQNEANNNTFVANEIFECRTGIHIEEYCLYNDFSWNTIKSISRTAIEITGASDHNVIRYNNISNCGGHGIFLESAFSNSIFYNTIYNCGVDQTDYYGVYLIASNNNIISYNTIIKVGGASIRTEWAAAFNVITWNDFIVFRGMLAVSDNDTNTFDYNFYDGWFSTDINTGGYYNAPYYIYSACEDDHPLIAPSNIATAFREYLTQPTVTNPADGGAQLSGTVIITWLEPYGSSSKTVNYDLFYSADGGNSWTELVSDLTSRQYSWDTTTVANGMNYALKVVASCPDVESSEAIRGYTLTIWNEEPTTTTTTTTTEPRITSGWTLLIGLPIVASFCILQRKKWKK